MALLDRVIPRARRRIYRRLWSENAGEHWRRYAAASALLLLVAGSTAALAWIMRDVINVLVEGEDPGRIAVMAVLVAVIFSLRGIATFGSALILARIGNRIVASLQSRLSDHLLRQNIRFFERYSLGDVYVRFGGGPAAVRAVIELLVLSVSRDLITLVALLAVMLIQNPALSVAAIALAPLAVLGVGWLTRRVRAITQRTIHAGAQIMEGVREIYQGARVVKAYTLERHLLEDMGKRIQHVRQLEDQSVRYSNLTVPLMDILGGIAFGCVIAAAGWNVASGDSDLGAFASFVTALLLAFDPARRLARLKVQLDAHMVNVETMLSFMDSSVTEPSTDDEPQLRLTSGGIRLTDVRFSYGDLPVLNGVSLEAPSGKITALVGASGAGKSTVLELLARFHAPASGKIELGGHRLDLMSLNDLRSNIALVGQQTFLFTGTIRENIRLGRLEATDAEIEDAARAANAQEFIETRPGGYNCVITDGQGLSGGERQRIAIARAMLRGAPILLLDEATSALDAESEYRVQEALERLMENRTTLVIAHRLSTIRNADVIHVMEAGRVIESGTHPELLARKGTYARQYALQFEDRAN